MIIFVLASICNFESSISIRNFLTSTLPTFLKSHNLNISSIPSTCPFTISSNQDIQLSSYKLVKKEPQSIFTCLKCEKQFRGQAALYDHLSNNHIFDDGICLADYCEFFPCGIKDEVVENRCKSVMSLCFDNVLLSEAVKYCDYVELSIWDMDLEKPGYVILLVLSLILTLIYYMINCGNTDELFNKHTKSKKKIN
ncbi:hypothetical protein SteCoe_11754 [Stentor coeruleus]|uniref:C2H2-type domain-containing protein n=1 Tax=Stentor coeruleus TaxID=5963 RepID=A0A1R2CCH8_9CILI|nr:hypothetical protein SteCoe_11754 [Stentor coeruleus]